MSDSTRDRSDTHATPSKGRGGGRGAAPGPTMDDMTVLMDQLASMSQSLADAQMAKKELGDAAAKAVERAGIADAEVSALRSKVESQSAEISKLREKVSFASLDAINEQLKAAKADAAEAKTENAALKDQNRILYQNYEDINAELKTMHEEMEAKVSALAALTAEKDELQQKHSALEVDLAHEVATVTELRNALSEAEAAAERSSATLAETQAALAAEARTAAREDAERLTQELHAMTTERNRARALVASIQSEQKKVVSVLTARQKEASALGADNQRLREDLARKSKSLQDALTALAANMEAPSNHNGQAAAAGGGGGGGGFGGLLHSLAGLGGSSSSLGGRSSSNAGLPDSGNHTIVVAAPSASSKMSARDLGALQLLCSRLSEACAEKDAQLSVLKKQCVGLGKRVIELEAGELPDFSDDAQEQKLRQEEAARRQRAEEEAQQLIQAANAAASAFDAPPQGPLSPGSELLRSVSGKGRAMQVATGSDGSSSSSNVSVAVVSHSPSPLERQRSNGGSSKPDYTGLDHTSASVTPHEVTAFPTLPHGAAAAALALSSPAVVHAAASPVHHSGSSAIADYPAAFPAPRSRAHSALNTPVKARSRQGSGVGPTPALASGLSIAMPQPSPSPSPPPASGTGTRSRRSSGGLTPSKPLSASLATAYFAKAAEDATPGLP